MVLPVIDDKSNFRIDFILSFTLYEKDAISRANIIKIDGTEVSFCSLEDMIILKVFAGRPRDIDDVQSIIRKNPQFNRQLVMDNLRELGKAIDVDLISRMIDFNI